MCSPFGEHKNTKVVLFSIENIPQPDQRAKALNYEFVFNFVSGMYQFRIFNNRKNGFIVSFFYNEIN